MHIQEPRESGPGSRPGSSGRTTGPATTSRCRSWSRLNVAEAFEMFLQTKYVGQRRFSLEGAESLIPLVDEVLTEAAKAGWTRPWSEWRTGAGSTCWRTSSASPTGRSSEFEGYLDPAARTALVT